jgi:hypothetical protein
MISNEHQSARRMCSRVALSLISAVTHPTVESARSNLLPPLKITELSVVT